MSQGYLKVQALGRLGADAEVRYGQSGNAVCSWRMACTTGYYDTKTQERKETTEWVSCVVFGKRAEALSKLLVKGKEIFVDGTLKTEAYEKDGEKRYRTQVVANEVVLCGGGNSERSEGAPTTQRTAAAKAPTKSPAKAAPKQAQRPADDFGYDGDDGGDVPF